MMSRHSRARYFCHPAFPGLKDRLFPWERWFPGQKDVFFSWQRKFLVSRYSSFVRVFPDVYCSVRSTVSTVEAIAICEVLAGFAQEGCLVHKGPF